MKNFKTKPDEIDIAILTQLRHYPPASIRQIGITIERSYVTVHQRIIWLEKNGYIQQADNVPLRAARGKILTVKGFMLLAPPPQREPNVEPVHS